MIDLSYIIPDNESEEKMSKKVKCKDCDGSGKIELDSYSLSDITSKPKTSLKKCFRCNGSGKIDKK